MNDLPSYAKPDLWLDEDNAVEFRRWKDDPEPYGGTWWHRPGPNQTRPHTTTPGWCVGGFAWRNPDASFFTGAAIWTLHRFEPLTLSPSLLCYSCGAHGFIRDGKWVPA